MKESSDLIKLLRRVGFLGSLDVQLADLADRMVGGGEEPLWLAVALADRAVREGHTCINLEKIAGTPWRERIGERLEDDEADGDEQAPLPAVLEECLPGWLAWRQCLVSGKAGKVIGGAGGETLLVLSGSRLYLRRYWEYEKRVQEKLVVMANASSLAPPNAGLLNKYFPRELRPPNSGGQAVYLQQKAARSAVERQLSILCGGPGTGKTFTLARTVAMLAEMNTNTGELFVVRIAAPTGKASARIVESIQAAKAMLRTEMIEETILSAIPEEASTLHRLLGPRHQSPYFKHDEKNPLAADMVIVDEASMIDLPMMAKLLDALPAKCRLMLVGDDNQLASVDPGRVFGDLCHAAQVGGKLDGCLTRLTESHRFPSDSAIGRVSCAINEGRPDSWQQLLDAATSPHLRVHDSTRLEQGPEFGRLVCERFAPYLGTTDAEAALAASVDFRILCALRKGPFGMRRMNRLVEKILTDRGLKPSGSFYDHQLVMITANTPALELYNGDVGVVLAKKDAAGKSTSELLAWFNGKNKTIRSIPVNLLPEHETAFAMTIHKAQGSEFPHVAMILPPEGKSPVLTRELLYTGITRVKIDDEVKSGQINLWCTENSFMAAVGRKTDRTTGLFAG